MNEKYKITFEIQPEEAKNQIVKLLDLLHINGILGATRKFGIIDATDEIEKHWSIFFDGDGNHRLNNIEVRKIEP